MAAPRNLIGEPERRLLRDEEKNADKDNNNDNNDDDGDSPAAKKPKFDRFPLNSLEVAVVVGVFFVFSIGLFCIYLTMPANEYGNVKLPRTVSDLRLLKFSSIARRMDGRHLFSNWNQIGISTQITKLGEDWVAQILISVNRIQNSTAQIS